jgi:hypothetical protein
MSKYHPIDVRYKGPSTAYRGSVKRPSFSQQGQTKAADNTKLVTTAVKSPWRGTAGKPKARLAQAPAPATSKVSDQAQDKVTKAGTTGKSWLWIIAAIGIVLVYLQ